jgi:hypothetical protein
MHWRLKLKNTKKTVKSSPDVVHGSSQHGTDWIADGMARGSPMIV